jgi:hypothetical protein
METLAALGHIVNVISQLFALLLDCESFPRAKGWAQSCFRLRFIPDVYPPTCTHLIMQYLHRPLGTIHNPGLLRSPCAAEGVANELVGRPRRAASSPSHPPRALLCVGGRVRATSAQHARTSAAAAVRLRCAGCAEYRSPQ